MILLDKSNGFLYDPQRWLDIVFLASEVSSNLTTLLFPLLILGFLRFTGITLQQESDSSFNHQNKGVHMLKNNWSRVKKDVVNIFACFIETVWAATVAVTVTLTGSCQNDLALAKNIISIPSN